MPSVLKEVDEAAILAFGRIFGNFACAILFHLRKPSIWCGVLTLRRFEYMIMGGAKSNLPIFEAQLLKFLRDPFPKRVRNNLRSKRFLHFSLVKTFLFYARTHRRNSIVLILAHTEIGSVDDRGRMLIGPNQ